MLVEDVVAIICAKNSMGSSPRSCAVATGHRSSGMRSSETSFIPMRPLLVLVMSSRNHLVDENDHMRRLGIEVDAQATMP